MSKLLTVLNKSKKDIAYFVMFVFLFILLFSIGGCLKDSSCKQCRIQTYDQNGALISSADWVEYCDQQLKDVEGQTSTVGDRTTKMVCK